MAPIAGSRNDAVTSIACVSAKDCYAVGMSNPQALPSPGLVLSLVQPGDEPLIEHFNGSKWAASPDVGSNAALFGVSCVSAAFCVAVGGTDTGHALALRFDGQGWRPMAVQNVSFFSTNFNVLYSVSCVKKTRCTAVGTDSGAQTQGGTFQQQLLETFDGSRWNLVSLDGWHGPLAAVGCHDIWCLATGEGEDLPGPPATPVAGAFHNASFVGTESWSQAKDPPTAIGSLACPSSKSCLGVADWAHGVWVSPSGVYEYRQGHWSATSAAANTGQGIDDTMFDDISCSTTRTCVIVGAGQLRSARVPAAPGQTLRPIIETNRSGAWRLVASPSVTGRDSYLTAVACSKDAACVAVGVAGSFAPQNSVLLPTRSISMVTK
jgi:hypothetical protein